MDLFRVHTTSFETAADVASKTEFNFKKSRFGTHGYNIHASKTICSSKWPKTMDLNLAETDEEAELQAVVQHRNI